MYLWDHFWVKFLVDQEAFILHSSINNQRKTSDAILSFVIQQLSHEFGADKTIFGYILRLWYGFACIIHSVRNYIGYILNIFLANIIEAQTVNQHHNLYYNMPLYDGIICVGSSKTEQRVDSV